MKKFYHEFFGLMLFDDSAAESSNERYRDFSGATTVSATTGRAAVAQPV